MPDTTATGTTPAICAPARQHIKLTAAQVQEIRTSPLSVRKAAVHYGVTFSYISAIRTGKARKAVEVQS